jgi:hypothetical protein
MKPLKPRTLLIVGAVYAAACIALGAAVSKEFYVGLVLLPFGRPILREVGALADRDEWQRLISYRSSHIAFLVAMLIAATVFVKMAFIDGGEPPIAVSVILLVSLLVKFATLEFQGRARRRAALAVAWVVGGAWLLFTLVSHGFSVVSLIEGAPCLLVLASGFVGMRWPKVGGGMLLAVGLGMLYLFVLAAGTTPVQKLLVATLLPIPVMLAGVFLFLGERGVSGDGTTDGRSTRTP